MANVKIIPSTIDSITQNPLNQITKRRVAAYARVSTDTDEQYTSYEAQMSYYAKFIKSKPEWEFVEVYADEGISGTSTKKRTSFNKMINDALDGKIDLIITKSISRFARNTLDTISYTRKLKAKGIEVYFEKENLWSLDEKTEFLLTIMASMAQEESRSISQNVTLGKRWGMQRGKVGFAYSKFLGYKKEDDKIVIDEEQAKIVRLIYRMFLVEGRTANFIAQHLKEQEILTPSGKNTNWTQNNIMSILTNEKYKGDALLQKTFIPDFLDHKPKKNEGHLPQYYVENSHPAIIEKDNWEQVQVEIARRKRMGRKYSGLNIFSSKLICGDCGAYYGKKIWHSNDQYAKEVYQCNQKFSKDKEKCLTPSITENVIKAMFVKAYNLAMNNKKQLIEDTQEIINTLIDTTSFDNLIADLTNELAVTSELVKKMVNDNAKTTQDQEEFQKKYNNMSNKYEKTLSKLEATQREKAYKEAQIPKFKAFMKELEIRPTAIDEWNEELWTIMLESATVLRSGSIVFKFHNGKKITIDKDSLD